MTTTPGPENSHSWNETVCRIFKAFIDKAESAKTNNEKKLTYEYLAIFLMGTIEGLSVIAHDQRGTSEEVDLWVANNSQDNFWQRHMGDPFIVECKNWDKPIGVQEIRNLESVMNDKNVHFALVLSKNGITGNTGRDAVGVIHKAFRNKKHIVILEQADLLEIANGMHPADKIQKKLYDLFLRS